MQISLAKLQTESLEIVGDVQFVVIEKLQVLIHPKLHEKSCNYLLIVYITGAE